jgi:hypothetical protein
MVHPSDNIVNTILQFQIEHIDLGLLGTNEMTGYCFQSSITRT